MPAPAPPRHRIAWTVRTRIIAVIIVVAAIGMLSVGFVVYGVERARILAQVDERLEASLESAAFIVRSGDIGGTSWESSTAALEAVVMRLSPDDNTGALGVIDGAARFEPGISLDVDLQAAPGFVAHAAAEGAAGPVIGTYAEEGVAWRYLAAPIAVQGSAEPAQVMFVTGYDLYGELAEIDGPAQVYLIAAAVAIVVIAGTAGVVATRLLRPLRRMRDTAERVSAQSLAERLPVDGRDDVSALAATMNDMLDRLDDALEGQRRLLSDVGHELKTPITIVSGHLDVMDADDPADVRSTRVLAVDELARMGRLVQDLANEAALHGPAPLSRRPTDAAALIDQVVRKAQGIDGATVEPGSVAHVTALLDGARITQALLQLAQNGVTHGDGRLRIGSRLRPGVIEFSVRDHGPGVPDEAKERIFERFHRGDPEGRGAGGSGLGLSIVQVIARAHGGGAAVRDADGGGAEFVVWVPFEGAATPVPPRPAAPGTGSSGAVSSGAVPDATTEAFPTVRLHDRLVVVPPRPAPPAGDRRPDHPTED